MRHVIFILRICNEVSATDPVYGICSLRIYLLSLLDKYCTFIKLQFTTRFMISRKVVEYSVDYCSKDQQRAASYKAIFRG